MYSVLGTILALVVFVASFPAARVVFDQLRHVDSVVLLVFRDVAIPGAAGYFGNRLAAKWVEKSEPKTVFYLFALTLIAVTALGFGLTLSQGTLIGQAVEGMFGVSLAMLAGIIGAYIFARRKHPIGRGSG